jgi:hypothetical protein
MRSIGQIGYRWLLAFGIDPMRSVIMMIRGFKRLPHYFRQFRVLRRQNQASPFSRELAPNYPCLHDLSHEAGIARGGYFYQDLWVARRIFERKPIKHVDVASRIDGFVAHVASFREIEVFDIRPMQTRAPNIVFKQCDFMNLDPSLRESTDSLSCLHALEHFGLGRYGDPVNINGHIDGLNALHSVLRPGGILYLSVPVGRQRIEFNSHRVFSAQTLLEWSKGKFELEQFTFVDAGGELHPKAPMEMALPERLPGLSYGLGIFEFRKLP